MLAGISAPSGIKAARSPTLKIQILQASEGIFGNHGGIEYISSES